MCEQMTNERTLNDAITAIRWSNIPDEQAFDLIGRLGEMKKDVLRLEEQNIELRHNLQAEQDERIVAHEPDDSRDQ